MQFLDISGKMDHVLCVPGVFCYMKSQGNLKKVCIVVCIDLENVFTSVVF